MQRGKLASTDRRYNAVLDSDTSSVEGFALFLALEISPRPFQVFHDLLALTLLPYDISIILKLKGHIKGRLFSRILIFLKHLSSGLKIIR